MMISTKNGFIEVISGNLKVVLSCLGASIVEVFYDEDLLTLAPINYDDLKRDDIYYGKTIGPIANRVKDGLVAIDGKHYYLPLNENGVSNHSGKVGLSNKIFDYSIEDNKIVFIYKDSQFGGDVVYIVKYSFLADNKLRIDYEVKSTNKAMLCITNHTFFTLGESSINGLSLRIPSKRFIESDKDSLVPLSIKPVDTCMDFNEEKAIIKDIDNPYLQKHRTKGYDHCFLLDDNVIQLSSLKYVLNIESDFPCVHIYSDNYSDGVKTNNTTLKSGRAVAIEPEDNLLDKPVIDIGETYQRYIEYSFTLKR